MKLTLLTFLYSLHATCGFLDQVKNLFGDDPKHFKAHKVHESNFCKKFTQKEEADYIVLECDQERPRISFNLDEDLKAINKAVLVEDYLVELKSNVIRDLEIAEKRMSKLTSCLKNRTGPDCDKVLDATLSTIRDYLPSMRITMAQMGMPGKIYSANKPERFERKPKHPITNKRIRSLSDEEIDYLKGHTDFLESQFRSEIINENDHLADCENVSPCSKEMIINSHMVKKFEKENKELKLHYNSIIQEQPLLAFVDFYGTESDQELLEQLSPIMDKLHGAAKQSLQHAKASIGDDRKELLIYNVSSEKLLKSKASMPYCDIHQDFLDELAMDELQTDVGLISASVVGGGICALSAGTVCAVGAAVGLEGASYYIEAERKRELERSFYTGLGDAQKYQDQKENLELAGNLAFLSVASEAVTSSKLITKNVLKNMAHEGSSQQEVKASYLNLFNANNKHQLSSSDQKHFADIAEELVKRETKDNPHLTSRELNLRLNSRLDSLVKECKGGK